jgi:hypothetical protein
MVKALPETTPSCDILPAFAKGTSEPLHPAIRHYFA